MVVFNIKVKYMCDYSRINDRARNCRAFCNGDISEFVCESSSSSRCECH